VSWGGCDSSRLDGRGGVAAAAGKVQCGGELNDEFWSVPAILHVDEEDDGHAVQYTNANVLHYLNSSSGIGLDLSTREAIAGTGVHREKAHL